MGLIVIVDSFICYTIQLAVKQQNVTNMKKGQFTFAPIVFITLIVVGLIICYYTGKFTLDTVMDTTKFHWGLKVLTVFLGGMLWVAFCFIIIVGVKLYESFKETFFN